MTSQKTTAWKDRTGRARGRARGAAGAKTLVTSLCDKRYMCIALSSSAGSRSFPLFSLCLPEKRSVLGFKNGLGSIPGIDIIYASAIVVGFLLA